MDAEESEGQGVTLILYPLPNRESVQEQQKQRFLIIRLGECKEVL